jgi:hypothetical protein
MRRRLAHYEEQEHQMRLFSYVVLFVTCFITNADAYELGRLFFTPQQRDQLEFQHAHNTSGDGGGGGRPYIIVNGVVQQTGGNRTVWVNGTPQQAGHSSESNPGTVHVNVPGKTQSVPVRVGQKLLIDRSVESSEP